MNEMVQRAKGIALEAHAGQKDKGGAPYFGHVERVAINFPHDPICQTVAYLHDVIEDTDYSLHDLDFPSDVIEAVQAITRRETETYAEFITRVSSNRIAKQVKIADLRDNLNPERANIAFPDEKRRASMRERYEKALRTLGFFDAP